MSVGSLTTTFTPPTSCLTSFSTTEWSTVATGVGFFFAGPFLTTSGCMPPNFQFTSTAYYSPGVCPDGYTSACTSLSSIGTVSETIVTCCPTSYACNSAPDLAAYPWQYTFGCQSLITAEDIFTSVVVVSGSVTLSSGPMTDDAGAVNALSVQVRYQATDFQSSTSTPTPTPTPTSPTTSASTSSTGGASSGGSHGISTGAAAGIGVGSAAVVILLAGAFIFVYTLGRRRRLAESQNPPVRQSLIKETVPPYTNNPASGYLMAEMPTEQVHRL
ncbi:hypothetical protein V8E51_010640 [Hyaloscypha variabilis]